MNESGKALNFKDVDLQKLIIPPLTTKEVRQSCTPLYPSADGKTNTLLSIHTPPMRVPFGLSSMVQEGSGKPQYSINSSFDNYRTSELMKSFHKFCSNVQDVVIQYAALNSVSWFGEKATPEMCRMMMNKWIKVSKKPENAAKYDPTLKITVRTKKEGGFWGKCIDVDGEEMCLDKLEAGCVASMKIKLTSIYLINGKFGMTWDLEWIKVEKKSAGGEFDYKPDMYLSEIASIPPMMAESVPEVSSSTNKREREDNEEIPNTSTTTKDESSTVKEQPPSSKRGKKTN